MANGDPVLADATETAARNAHPLFLAAKETTKGISSSFNTIQIAALDRRLAPDVQSGEEFATAMASVLRYRFQALTVVGSPEQFDNGGRIFWKVKFDVSVQNQVARGVQAVTTEKGYVLLFVFTSVDASKLDDLVGTLLSVRFTAPH